MRDPVDDSEPSAEAVHAALRAWHRVGGAPDSYLDSLWLVQEKRDQQADRANPALLRLATNLVLQEAIEELAEQDAEAARVLRLRFFDNATLWATAHQLNVSDHTVSRLQRKAIDQLAMLLARRERQIRDRRVQTVAARLPPPSYSQLFGVDAAQSQLEALLQQKAAPWVLAIVGMGGIGKTALADSVTRRALQAAAYADIAWLRIVPQSMDGQLASPEITWDVLLAALAAQVWPGEAAGLAPRRREIELRQVLKTRPFLIVVDNLESQTDLAYLLSRLKELANPSRFLLTARTRPADAGGIFSLPVDELSLADADSLVRHHARELGLTAVAEAAPAELEAIYAVTGGNPLALKLVVSLLDVLPLPDVLASMSRGRVDRVEDLYHHIYWQAWQILSPQARHLLKVMPLVTASGGTPAYLKVLSGMSDAELWPAMQELRSRSLLEVRGTLSDKWYGVHRLTETFLQTEIIAWSDTATSP